MRNVALSCVAWLTISLTLSSCKSFPVLEVCVSGTKDGEPMSCVDKRLPEGKQEYERYPNNDICTNPDDYNTGLDWVRRHDK